MTKGRGCRRVRIVYGSDAIVDDNDLEMSVGLLLDTPHRLRNESFLLVVSDENGD
jgi:hypothetical protein